LVPAVPQAPGGPATGARVSGWAIAALVFGILSPFTCMLTTLPAVIAGIVALVKIGNSDGRLKGLGMAIAGMALPVVLLPIMALGMGIMMPALARTRHLAFRMTCGKNLVSLGKAMSVYAGDYDGRFPTSSKWCDLLVQYTEVPPEWFRCHGVKEGPSNYAMNKFAEGLGPGAPANMVLLFETYPAWNQVGGAEVLTVENHSGDGCNVLFMDGHVGFIKPEFLRQLQ
jgi:prepilin-type processing-associated H-X9-DG protein